MIGMAATTSRRKSRVQLAQEIQDAVRKHLPDRDRTYDPIVELALVGANPRITPELRTMANKEVAGYLYHKLKAVDLTVAQKGPVTIQVIDFNQINDTTDPMKLINAQHQLMNMVEADDDEED